MFEPLTKSLSKQPISNTFISSDKKARFNQMRVAQKWFASLLPILLVLLMVQDGSAQLIFSDNFDNSPDWQSQQTKAKSAGGMDRAWPATYAKTCTSTCPPEGWTAYRTSASHFTDTPGNDTYILGAAGARGGNGKGITLNVESTSGYGDWAGGSLDVSLGTAGYQELYVRYWLKYDANWLWTDPENTQHSQQKLIRISRFTGDINNTATTNPQMYFTPTLNGPSWMPDWYYNKSYTLTSFFSSEFFNVQPSGSIGYGPTQTFSSLQWPSDGQWHSYEFRVKMNSTPGVANGEWEIWIDGQNTADKHAVKKNVLWVDAAGSVTQGWNYLMFLDNITVAPAPVSAKKEMQILMDDAVVSTHYSGPPPKPATLTATATSGSSVKLKWTAGINGATYLLNGYHIYYGKDPNNLAAKVDVGNVLEYDVTSLDPATRYYFAVSAFNKASYENNDNEGVRSITASATTTTATAPAPAPADTALPVVSISAPANGSIVSGTVTVNVAASDNVGVQKVELYLNGSIFGVIGAAPYSLPWNTSNSPDGSCTMTAKAYDAAGNVGNTTVSFSIKNYVADAAAPIITSFTMPASSTSLSVPVTALTATDDIGVTGYFISESATAPAATAGTWSASAPASVTFAAAGSRTAYAWSKDAAGKVSAAKSAIVAITLPDVIAPAVTIMSLASGTQVSGTVAVSASASDNVAVSKVEFLVDGILKATSTAAPYSFSWNTTTSANGIHTVIAKAYDAAGNVGQSTSATVTVANDTAAPTDTTAPTVYLTSPTYGSQLKGTVAVNVVASDNVAVSKVEFFVNGVLKSTSTGAPWSFNWNTQTVANGSYNVGAKAYDATGNAGQAETKPVTVANDTTAPVVSIAAPIGASTVTGTVVVLATASDNVAVTRVEFYLDGVLKATSTAAPYSFSWNTTTSANGAHTVIAKAYDAAGNVGQSANATVTVANATAAPTDTTAPTVYLTSPTYGSQVKGTVAVNANASDNVAVSKVEFFVNGVLKSTSTGAPWSFNWNTQTVANGSYNVGAKAYDAAGNVGQAETKPVTVANDTTAPVVSIAAPLSSSTAAGTVAVSANSSDNVAVTKVEFYVNSALAATSTGAPYGFNWNTATLASGAYTLTAKAYDAAGNVGQSAGVTVNVANDTTAPTVTLLSPKVDYLSSSRVSISATATDNVAVTRMELYVDGTLILNTSAGSFSTSRKLSLGLHTITVKAYDAAKNIGSVSKTVTRQY